jgi:hypothetical protein
MTSSSVPGILIIDNRRDRARLLKSVFSGTGQNVQTICDIPATNKELLLQVCRKHKEGQWLIAHERNIMSVVGDIRKKYQGRVLQYSGDGDDRTILRLNEGDEYGASHWKFFFKEADNTITSGCIPLWALRQVEFTELVSKILPLSLVCNESDKVNICNAICTWWDKKLVSDTVKVNRIKSIIKHLQDMGGDIGDPSAEHWLKEINSMLTHKQPTFNCDTDYAVPIWIVGRSL